MGLEKVRPTGTNGARALKTTEFPVPLQKAFAFGDGLKKEARQQHEKRDEDTPAPPPSRIKDIRFTLGAQGRPAIRHDHGFLDDGNGNIDLRKRRPATTEDRVLLAKWIAKLEVAEAVRPEFVDGTTAYRHFLFGRGMKRPSITNVSSRTTAAASGSLALRLRIQPPPHSSSISKDFPLLPPSPRATPSSFRVR